jgi:hypothetical protein
LPLCTLGPGDMVGWLRTRMNAHVGDNGCVDHVPFQWYDCNKSQTANIPDLNP